MFKLKVVKHTLDDEPEETRYVVYSQGWFFWRPVASFKTRKEARREMYLMAEASVA